MSAEPPPLPDPHGETKPITAPRRVMSPFVRGVCFVSGAMFTLLGLGCLSLVVCVSFEFWRAGLTWDSEGSPYSSGVAVGALLVGLFFSLIGVRLLLLGLRG